MIPGNFYESAERRSDDIADRLGEEPSWALHIKPLPVPLDLEDEVRSDPWIKGLYEGLGFFLPERMPPASGDPGE
jgi:hypothetical protein